jgi:hypothetical protein
VRASETPRNLDVETTYSRIGRKLAGLFDSLSRCEPDSENVRSLVTEAKKFDTGAEALEVMVI